MNARTAARAAVSAARRHVYTQHFYQEWTVRAGPFTLDVQAEETVDDQWLRVRVYLAGTGEVLHEVQA